MNDFTCNECGAILPQNATECPNCGCPVPSTPQNAFKKKTLSSLRIQSVISLILGIIILVLGVSLMKKDVSLDPYSAKKYDAEYTAFGGDFYTSIYGATDIIVDELSDINDGLESLSETMISSIEAIYYAGGVIVSALGLGVIAMSCCYISKNN